MRIRRETWPHLVSIAFFVCIALAAIFSPPDVKPEKVEKMDQENQQLREENRKIREALIKMTETKKE